VQFVPPSGVGDVGHGDASCLTSSSSVILGGLPRDDPHAGVLGTATPAQRQLGGWQLDSNKSIVVWFESGIAYHIDGPGILPRDRLFLRS